MSEPASFKTNKRIYFFAAIWIVSIVILSCVMVTGTLAFNSTGMWIALLVLILCSSGLMFLIRNPIVADLADHKTEKGKLVGVIALVVIVLLLVQAVMGKFMMMIIPVVAAVVLVLIKPQFDKKVWLYAGFLALLAGIAGLGAEWITFITPVQWGFFQIPLTLLSLLAGWGILHRHDLLRQGIGRSRFLTVGTYPAVRSFLLGMLLATPWALANIVMGSVEGEKVAWVKSWWQPLVAIQPGIAEEAWGRVLMVPLVFLLFRKVAPTRVAFFAAMIVMAYWFAYLHTSGNVVSILVSTIIIGTVIAMPVSIICLYRDLETAIGFHFWMDFLKFIFALFVFSH